MDKKEFLKKWQIDQVLINSDINRQFENEVNALIETEAKKLKDTEEWILTKEETPSHKDLVIVSDGMYAYPAIYFDNSSFVGFYPYTTYYHSKNILAYDKVWTNGKFEDIVKWRHMPESNPEPF